MLLLLHTCDVPLCLFIYRVVLLTYLVTHRSTFHPLCSHTLQAFSGVRTDAVHAACRAWAAASGQSLKARMKSLFPRLSPSRPNLK